ncbi:MAG: rod shape-determining protein MreC [Christensenellales bacterium]|jgi:rod shape-determining protein MreC
MSPTKKKRKQLKRERKRLERGERLRKFIGYGIISVLVFTIVIMIASQFFPEITMLDTPRRIVSRVITPVQKAFSGATDTVATYLRKLKYRSTLEDEYIKLQEKVDELTDRAMRVEALEYQLAQFADLDDEIVRNPRLDGVKAKVISRNSDNYSFTLGIDIGTNRGIKDYMAVAVPGALIGYTYDVKPDSCLVKCIVDSDCSISALIESSRDQGTLQGTLSINGMYECRMYYLSFSTLPRPGDRVVTSGVGMEFPKGIPIGYVRESTRGLDANKQYIVVDPIADFDHIEYVIVYRYTPTVAEAADNRGAMTEATFIPLPTKFPMATFIGQQTALTPSPSPSTSPSPTPLEDTTEPLETPAASDDVSYNDYIPSKETEQIDEEKASPTPSAEPTSTFSVEQMTVEDD